MYFLLSGLCEFHYLEHVLLVRVLVGAESERGKVRFFLLHDLRGDEGRVGEIFDQTLVGLNDQNEYQEGEGRELCVFRLLNGRKEIDRPRTGILKLLFDISSDILQGKKAGIASK